METTKARCLVLACGNTLRGDDGIGPWLAEWAEERFKDKAGVRVVSRQQWTPDLVEEIAVAETVLFVDCSVAAVPGSVNVIEVEPAAAGGRDTHHQGAPELLGYARDFYDSLPRASRLLTVGAGTIEISEEFSQPVLDAIPLACERLEDTVTLLLAAAKSQS
jgi:hydrogenase maturation protease